MKNGKRLELSISSATDNRPNADAEILVADELRRVGIALSVKNYAGSVLFAEHGPLYGGTYDMAWIVNTEGVDPDNLANWGCDWFPPHGANTNFYCNHDRGRIFARRASILRSSPPPPRLSGGVANHARRGPS